MTSDKTEKKISYFPRAWGAGRKDGPAKMSPRRGEPNESPLSEEQAQTMVEVAAASEALESADSATTYPASPCDILSDHEEPSETDTALYQDPEPLPTGARCDPPTLDQLDSSADSEPLECGDSALDQEGLGWLAEDYEDIAVEVAAPQLDSPAGSHLPRVKVNILGVRFGYACRIYHFDSGDLDVAIGDWVLVKTEKGLGLGQVAVAPREHEISAAQIEGVRKVLRKAGKADFDQKARCVQRESEAYSYCLEMIGVLGLPMKLVATECFFDGSKYVFYFTAEGRVDFRELVKLLVARFPVRIEMRQIGVRHEAKMTGGLACCGEELCCSRFLTDFRPVSVKMAKTQNLSLNPTKISGVCGRLMCCLAYEYDTYEEFRKGLPKVGKKVNTPKGEGVVIKHDPLTQTILVRLDEETTLDLTKEELLSWECPPPPRKGKKKP